MNRYLMFRLYGPMASWGDVAVGEVRPGRAHPSRSAVIGLLAGAVGVDRADEDMQLRMARGYGLAVKVQHPGTYLADYHTIQVPATGTGRNRRVFVTRKDEILSSDKLHTILSRRDYRMDGLYVCAVWVRNDDPPFTLDELASALESPVYAPYLGRKSCPPALPMEPRVAEAETLKGAFASADFAPFGPEPGRRGELYWDECDAAGLEPLHVFERRDEVLSRKRWQFDTRKEYHAQYEEEG